MSELRKNPFTGEWTLCAENRKNRPYEFVHKIETGNQNNENCPFCSGHEQWTTAAVYQDGENDRWQIRVFPNKFPAVTETPMELSEETLYEHVAGRGRHEVLVDTPLHEATIDLFSVGQIERILAVLQERYCILREQAGAEYVQIFKNCGPAAGMSIRHSHWQILALPLIPQRQQMLAAHMRNEDCLLCKILDHEKEKNLRIAAENTHFVAITPYASRFPYELWICPKRHFSSYDRITPQEMTDLAALLQGLLQGVTALQDGVGYNICMLDGAKGTDFHWHVEILPRIGGFAGFEFATGSYINPVLPETAAAYYQKKVKASKSLS